MTKYDHLAGKNLGSGTFTWNSDRALLYAVGVGAGLEDPFEELQFTTENTQGVAQQVVPTFMALMSPEGGWIRDLGFPRANGTVIPKASSTASRACIWPADSAGRHGQSLASAAGRLRQGVGRALRCRNPRDAGR